MRGFTRLRCCTYMTRSYERYNTGWDDHSPWKPDLINCCLANVVPLVWVRVGRCGAYGVVQRAYGFGRFSDGRFDGKEFF